MAVLKKGTGTPYVAIFNGSNDPIIDLTLGLPIGVFVEDFKYKYVEDGCDTAEIGLKTNNVNIADHPDLQYLMTIKLQWGWLFPDGTTESSPVRSLVIKDYSIDFTRDGVNMNIELIDSSFLLKNEPPTITDDKERPLSSKDKEYKHIEGVLKGSPHNIQIIQIKKN